ncbi:MAG: DNA helicase PcrA [Clostridium sp.]|jgi:DNA helicase-2/ATP-dependent DNA helicase PcrA|nr:DNA helicase PcrA [Clostridium sp.]
MSIYDTLNEEQKEAVLATEGPLLILAGAGSGKTRVVTHRIAYLLDEKNVSPWNILALTFTNKAAGEMRERVDQLVGFGADQIWISTFHSTCVRILRRFADKIGYDNHFTIYDGDDQKSVIKEVIKRLQIDTKNMKERAFLSVIRENKDELVDEEQFATFAGGDYIQATIAKVYQAYQAVLRTSNAMDFDDLIVNTVKLFTRHPDILAQYQERFRYISVDEYQDTNTAQFRLVELLAAKYRNLCVVGDDDQSIYKFRGANIHNILNFEKQYPQARVIRLEQNYRSTQNILNAANAVIAHNHSRKKKSLWTKRDVGNLIRFRQLESASEEAQFIADSIVAEVGSGKSTYGDYAVLYRTNAQSRLIEERFVHKNIPYDLVGGVNFYARREIKDILAYLRVIANENDDLALSRIINVPKRGIGTTTSERLARYASEHSISLLSALLDAKNIPLLKEKVYSKLQPFAQQMDAFAQHSTELSIADLIQAIVDGIEYEAYLNHDNEEDAADRMENIMELVNKATEYEKDREDATLSGFLEEISLIADIDRTQGSQNLVLLMTLHSAKGLEFPYVFLSGMEEGVFPNDAVSREPADIEEERRLAYVGITRAKEELTLTCASYRMIHGETRHHKVSRFVKEIPQSLLDQEKAYAPKAVEPTVVDTRPKAILRPRATPHADKPFIAQGISSLNNRSGISKGSDVATQEPPLYQVGDRVNHLKYGDGQVVEIVQEPRDYKVTVDFDRVGQKIMFAAFARLKRL